MQGGPKVKLNPDFLQSVPTSIFPSSDNAFDIGSDTLRWRNIRAVNIYGDTFYEGGTPLSNKYAPLTHTHTRNEITDFWSTPFWENIPDKPSAFPPEPHTHSRSDITDFWASPFWDNIPDKPSTFPPSAHGSSHNIGGSDEIPDLVTLRSDFDNHKASKTAHVPSGKYVCATSRSDQLPSWNDIPDKPSEFPPESHTHSRSEITDFWDTPFWDNIPDKPSTFPPESHTHTRSDITDFWSSPFWDNIPDKPSTFPPESHGSSHNIGASDEIPDLATLRDDFDSHKVSTTDHVPSGKYICSTSRSDQLPSWNDIPDKPSAFPPEEHTHTRSDITDFWSSPFWDNIPDKPSVFPPESHGSSHNIGGSDEIPDLATLRNDFDSHESSKIAHVPSGKYVCATSRSDQLPSWNDIPDKPSTFPPEPHTHNRSDITDFWASPFWNNIPDKPSTFPPSAHASSHKPGGSDALFPADFHITPASDNAYDIGTTTLRWRDGWFANGLAVGDITSRADKLHVKSSPDTGILVESTGDHPAITLKGYDGTNYYSTKLVGAYHGRNIEWHHPITGGYFMFVAPSATSDNPLQNCWKLWFRCHYWNGSASKNFEIQIIPEVLDTSPTGRLRFWMSVAGDVLTLHSSTGIISHKNVIPSTDNAFDLGSESYRWRSVRAVNGYFSNIVQVGDLVFNNGWRISEHEKYGLVLISPDGKMYKIRLEEVNNDEENKV